MSEATKKIVIGEISLGIVIILILSISGLFLPTSSNDAERFTRIVEKRMASVVRVESQIGERQVHGAGVLVSKYGHILTVAHLFEKKQHRAQVVLLNDARHSAKILQIHPTDDIALIKIDIWTPYYAPLASFKSLSVGQEVVAIGHPLGFHYTVTHGIISKVHAALLYTQWVQMDTPINPGNSGGPVFNLKGEIVGIVSHYHSLTPVSGQTGLNMAVSIDAIHKFLNQFRGLDNG